MVGVVDRRSGAGEAVVAVAVVVPITACSPAADDLVLARHLLDRAETRQFSALDQRAARPRSMWGRDPVQIEW